MCAACDAELRQSPKFRVLSVDAGALSVALIDSRLFHSFRVQYRPLGQLLTFVSSINCVHWFHWSIDVDTMQHLFWMLRIFNILSLSQDPRSPSW